MREGFLGVKEIRELGVARISVGPELWRAAMKAFTERDQSVTLLFTLKAGQFILGCRTFAMKT
jgi:hypothetical protein